MKTDDLVSMLANGEVAVSRRRASSRIWLAVLLGLPFSFAILLSGYGVRHDIVQAMFWPMFWVKVLFPLCIAAAGFVAAERLARPGVKPRHAWMGAVLPVLGVWLLAAIAWFTMPADDRMPALMGQSWRICAASIGLMALPVFAAALFALKGMAPTRPALAGAAVGALAGGVGASVYALHCMELTAPFLAVWYVSGIAVPVLVGALLGPRLLRW
ncbi:NrsF family protein [Variovorax sp. 160MFSha2.1]|uniref:NrsF family protein n=1 Tax=Variovorax sp. 160MFSha2.1 TaxID=3158367 RepID=UPI003AAF22FD